MLGVAWLGLELVTWGFPRAVPESSRPLILVSASVVALVWGAICSIPPIRFVKRFPARSLEIELTVGNILDSTATHHVAVLSSDYFDSCVETAISLRSLMGQLIATFFSGVKAKFDAEVDSSLRSQGIAGTHNPSKKRGTNRLYQYPAGTVAAVSLGARKAIVVVGATFDDVSSKTTTSASTLWTSLLAVWNAAAIEGHRGTIAIPIWGANLGNAPGNRLVLFQTLLCSFAASVGSQNQPPTKHLKIVVWEGDYHPQEFREMVQVLKQFEI